MNPIRRPLNRRAFLHTASAGAATLALPAWAQTRSIVLGQSAAFSGPAAQLGIQLNAGAKLCFEQFNAAGGVGGQPVEIRTADDGYEPDRCKANTERFIRDDVFALIGYVGTPTSVAALPLAKDNKVPFFGPFTGAEVLREPFNRHVFHVRASYYDETELIVNQLHQLGQDRIAVFYQNDSYGKAGLDGVTKALARRNLKPVAAATVERNSVDVAAAVQQIVPAMPHAVVQISAYKSCAAFVRAARAAGYGAQICNVSFVGTQALADELGPDGRGVMVSQVVPFPYSASNSLTRDFLAAVAKSGGKVTPNYSSLEGYLVAKVFAEGLKRAGRAASRETLIGALETLQRVDFGGFMVNFGPRSRVASDFVELSMLTGDGRVRR
jgi:branched-chain amino acid transport system substrate-binding protein